MQDTSIVNILTGVVFVYWNKFNVATIQLLEISVLSYIHETISCK